MTVKKELKFVISGAGLIGLLVAHSLKSRNIDFVIFDRDENERARVASGWAITLHWALETFEQLLPKHLLDQIYDAEVRPNFHKVDTGNFKYINASSGETIISIPPSRRLRIRREQLRQILLQDIDVKWNCKMVNLDTSIENKIVVTCSNGEFFKGDVLLGCDGSNSITRRLVCPDTGSLYHLPVRFCGSKIKLSGEEVEKISEKFDPLLFQGTIPSNETFFWFSMLETPEYTKKNDSYYAQVNLSWKSSDDDEEPFKSNHAKAIAMIKHAEGLNDDLYWLVMRAAQNKDSIQEIKLCDWPLVEWDSKNDKVILLGDSAHAMTMYRGEAANHGITDVSNFMLQLDEYLSCSKSWREVVATYSLEIKARAAPAVLLSRKACLDAHDMTQINSSSESPLLAIRKRL
ncbi:uncharacterized protein PRCAT00001400001 [Priceomyces carsonii]|uniref:uncharacterized protein n=1 Tax=Priceomyces carsonii TaxID=28549 RepID=UPI002ED90DC4|nr:unnamed protein product [Priceomyces carsonii]